MLIRRNQEVSGNTYRDEPALDNNCNTVDFPDETIILVHSNLNKR